jgi:hypothetical protein
MRRESIPQGKTDMSKNIEAGNGRQGATHVTVHSKLPNGIILQLSVQEDRLEPTLGVGTRMYKAWVKDPMSERYTVPGTALAVGQVPAHRIIGGYATLAGVPVDFWETWLEQNKDSDIVRRHLIFASRQDGDGDAQARDGESLRTGLEPLAVGTPEAPVTDPRVGVGKNGMRISTAPEMAGR